MQQTHTQINIGPANGECGAYASVRAALSALTTQDHQELARLADRRLNRLRHHSGFARYLAGVQAEDLIGEAFARIESGTRRTKLKQLQSHRAFVDFVRNVVSSLASNYVRHAEPQIEHAPVGLVDEPGPFVEPLGPDNVVRNVTDRESVHWLFRLLEPSLSDELKHELVALRELSERGEPAEHVVQRCSEALLAELQAQAHQHDWPTAQPELAH